MTTRIAFMAQIYVDDEPQRYGIHADSEEELRAKLARAVVVISRNVTTGEYTSEDIETIPLAQIQSEEVAA